MTQNKHVKWLAISAVQNKKWRWRNVQHLSVKHTKHSKWKLSTKVWSIVSYNQGSKYSCTSMKNYSNIIIFLIINLYNNDNFTLIFFIDTNLSMPNSIMSNIWPSKQRPVKEHKMLFHFCSMKCSKEWVSSVPKNENTYLKQDCEVFSWNVTQR